MQILAMETTERVGSVAAWHDDKLLLQNDLTPEQQSARSLAPALRDLLGQVGWRPAEVELIAVSLGPGSFTGLRVGVTTAKTFAYAMGAEVLGVDTLEVIAAGSPGGVDRLSVAMDAQRGDVVVGQFDRGEDGWFRVVAVTRLVPLEEWLDDLLPGCCVSGPVLQKVHQRLPSHVTALDAGCWRPVAANVARLAARDYASGRHDDLWSLSPRYSRRPAAVEKWEQRE
jgi:tRNA threonylcarbamoyladenosine biosynthesis protein TsaB